MLSFKEIAQFYPPEWERFSRNIMREYLQFKVLEIIFNSPQGIKLSFIGGTALRIVCGYGRFSEDLDFDNFDLTKEEFKELSSEVEKKLQLEGYNVSTETKTERALRCRIKFSGLLFQEGLSSHKDEKILIQLDTVAHNFNYNPEIKLLNKFDVFTQTQVTPLNIILSQKIYAAFNRARLMGRDFYDIVFLLSMTKPNYRYLKQKINIGTAKELRKYLINKNRQIDFNYLSKDVEPFLIKPEDKKRVELFPEYINQFLF